jgi:hypothetical protein
MKDKNIGREDTETTIKEVEADVSRTTDKIKLALHDHKQLQERVDQETEKLRQSKNALYEADRLVSNLTKQLLEETLGSVYDARVVLYHLTGKR